MKIMFKLLYFNFIIFKSLIDFIPISKIRKSNDRICIDISDNKDSIKKLTKCFHVNKENNIEDEYQLDVGSSILGKFHVCSIIDKNDNYKTLECNPYKDIKDVDNVTSEINFLRNGLQVPSKYANNNINIINNSKNNNYIFVASGDSHICAIFEIPNPVTRFSSTTSTLKLKCWGDNSFGQITISQEVKDLVRNINRNQLQYFKFLAFKNSTCISLNIDQYPNYNQTYNNHFGRANVNSFRHLNGYLKCWGILKNSEIGKFYNIIEVGDNDSMCLGRKSSNNQSTYVLECYGSTNLINIPDELKSKNLSASMGYDHACTQVSTDIIPQLGCWGDNTSGQTNIPFSLIFSTVSYVASNQYSCAAKLNAQVLCWGQLDTDPHSRFRTIPLKVSTYISAGGTHGCGIYDGELKCYGKNDFRQLDVPASHQFDSVQVTNGWDLSCSLNIRGKADCWGVNLVGQAQVPEKLQLGRVQVVSVHTALNRSCAVYTTDSVNLYPICWGGHNEYGENTIPSSPANAKLEDFTVGDYHTCLKYKKIICFGKNLNGQSDVHKIALNLDSNTDQIAAGGEHTCVILNNFLSNIPHRYSVVCWGSNSHGQLTIPSFSGNTVKFTHLKAGDSHSCVIHTSPSNSHLWCWGDRYKQGSQEINGIQTRYVAVGNDFDCRIGADWQAKCWGDNEFGQCKVPEWGQEEERGEGEGKTTNEAEDTGKVAKYGDVDQEAA